MDTSEGKTARANEIRRLYVTWFDFVWRTIGYRVRTAEREDIAQQVWADAAEQLPDIPAEKRKAWLYGVTRRKTLHYLRTTYRRRRLVDVPAEPYIDSPGPTSNPEIAMMRAEQARLLREALDRMDPELREIFAAHELEELSAAEIAEQHELSRAAIVRRLKRARAQFDEIVSELRARDDRMSMGGLLPLSVLARMDTAPPHVREAIWSRVQADTPADGGGASRRGWRPALPGLRPALSLATGGAGGAVSGAFAGAISGAVAGAIATAIAMRACAPTPEHVTTITAPLFTVGPPVVSVGPIPSIASPPALAPAPPISSAVPFSPPSATARPVIPRSSPSAPVASTGPAHDDIADERDLFESATRALDQGDRAEALRALADHARRFPHGRLAAERDQLRAALLASPQRAAGVYRGPR